MSENIKFVKGTEIRCPSCNKLQLTAKKDILRPGLVRSSDWGAILGDTFHSKCCGISYLIEGKFYTQFGWRDEVLTLDTED